MRVPSGEGNDESEKQQRSLATRTATNKKFNEKKVINDETKLATNDEKKVARIARRKQRENRERTAMRSNVMARKQE